MEIRVLFWNVENFVGGEDRTEAVKRHIQEFDPDVFCLCEIKDKVAMRSLLMDKLIDYDFGLTDGQQRIELLAGWRKGKFQQVLFTQRREFKANQNQLRPGSLLTAKINEKWFNFLFLHTDSGVKIKDYRNRQEMFEKIWSMKSILDDISTTPESYFAILGDYNTMGRSQIGQYPKITGQEEINDLKHDASDKNMTLLDKTEETTLAWGRNSSGNYRLSNLDHVIVSNNLDLIDFEKDDGSKFPAEVSGWVNITDEDERVNFIENISDHCSVRIKISLQG
ncbi:MAG: endonuclease/exonuclease/phosphatase family protein [Bacteroidota bacterium]